MDCSHLSVVVDLSPSQWEICGEQSLSLSAFLSQLLVFLNAHIALKHENSLAVFAALPGKRSAYSLVMLVHTTHFPQRHALFVHRPTW